MILGLIKLFKKLVTHWFKKETQIQLIRIEIRVPEYGWTTQKVFHLMNFIVNGVRAIVFGFHLQVFTFHPKVLVWMLLEVPGLLFFSTYTLLVLFWAEIYHQARSLPTDKLRVVYVSVNAGVYLIQGGLWLYLWLDDNGLVQFLGKLFVAGIDSTGGYSPTLDAIVQGLGYYAPPIMALLFILDDEVVKVSPHARAIRDVEDEGLRSFFYGMSPWQFILIVAASSVGEELFYRAAVQGALAELFLKGNDLT